MTRIAVVMSYAYYCPSPRCHHGMVEERAVGPCSIMIWREYLNVFGLGTIPMGMWIDEQSEEFRLGYRGYVRTMEMRDAIDRLWYADHCAVERLQTLLQSNQCISNDQSAPGLLSFISISASSPFTAATSAAFCPRVFFSVRSAPAFKSIQMVWT